MFIPTQYPTHNTQHTTQYGAEIATSLQHYHMHTSATDHLVKTLVIPASINAGDIIIYLFFCDFCRKNKLINCLIRKIETRKNLKV